MADGGVVVPRMGVAEGTRGVKEVGVVASVVSGVPAVPDPVGVDREDGQSPSRTSRHRRSSITIWLTRVSGALGPITLGRKANPTL